MNTKTYTTTVDYSKSVNSLVKAGKYDWANDDINDVNFPDLLIKSSKEELKITLFGFNKNRSSKWVIKRLKSKGYRPATLKELLSLGTQHPDLQRNDWIVALGSEWRNPGGNLHVPCLDGYGSNRHLGLSWFEGDWYSDWRFAAVSLKLKPSKPLDTKDTWTLGDLENRVEKIEARLEKLSRI